MITRQLLPYLRLRGPSLHVSEAERFAADDTIVIRDNDSNPCHLRGLHHAVDESVYLELNPLICNSFSGPAEEERPCVR
jgi:hypothetical protein